MGTRNAQRWLLFTRTSFVSMLRMGRLQEVYKPKGVLEVRVVFYCTKEHQVLDWKAGHKAVCQGTAGPPPPQTSASTLAATAIAVASAVPPPSPPASCTTAITAGEFLHETLLNMLAHQSSLHANVGAVLHTLDGRLGKYELTVASVRQVASRSPFFGRGTMRDFPPESCKLFATIVRVLYSPPKTEAVRVAAAALSQTA